jgi:hypothetical protein
MVYDPELTQQERAALDALDLSEIFGTPEERIRFALNKALQYMQERNIAQSSAGMAWAEHAKLQAENNRLQTERNNRYDELQIEKTARINAEAEIRRLNSEIDELHDEAVRHIVASQERDEETERLKRLLGISQELLVDQARSK